MRFLLFYILKIMKKILTSSDVNDINEEGLAMIEEAEEQHRAFCDKIAKELKTTLSVFMALPEWTIDELSIKWFVLKLNTFCSPTQFDIVKDGKRVGRLWMRGGRVKCYFGDRKDEWSEQIYEKNYANASRCSFMTGDFFTDQDIEESIRLISERLAN